VDWANAGIASAPASNKVTMELFFMETFLRLGERLGLESKHEHCGHTLTRRML
jgi:hypothetical protein